MSTKRYHTIDDFMRFGTDIDVECRCGHTETLPYLPICLYFAKKEWNTGLGAAIKRFKCKKCGGRPIRLGPISRD